MQPSLSAVQRVVAWTLSILSVVITVAFFGTMTIAAPWLTETAFGTYGSRAILAALGILVAIALSVWAYGTLSTAVDRESREAKTTDRC